MLAQIKRIFPGLKFWGDDSKPADSTVGGSVLSSLFPYGGMSPMLNPDDLVGQNGIQIYQKMYHTDPEIASSHEEIVLSALANGWNVKSTDPQDDHQNEIADFIRDNFRYLGGQNAAGVVIQTAEDVLFEFFINSLRDGVGVWEQNLIEEDGRIWLDHLKGKPPQDWELMTDDYGNLKNLRFNVLGVTDHNPNKFLIIPWMPHFCNHYGQSRYRRLYACYWLSEVMFRMAGRYAEKRSGGVWIGRYPKGDRKTQDKLMEILRKAQASGVLVLEEGVTAELEKANESASGGDFWWRGIEILKNRIRRGMLGLETTAAAGRSGDAAGQESRDDSVKRPLVEFSRSVVCSHVNQQIIQRLVDWNFGPQEAYPEFVLLPPPKDAQAAATIIVQLSNAGAKIPIREAEERTGWRLTPEEGEAYLSIDQVAAASGGSNNLVQLPDGIRDAVSFAEQVRPLTVKSVQSTWAAIDAEYMPLILGYTQRIIEWGSAKLASNWDKWKVQRSGVNDLNLPYTGSIKSLFVKMTKAYWRAGMDSAREQIQKAMSIRQYAESVGGYSLPDDYSAFQGEFWWKSYTDAMKSAMTKSFAASFEAGVGLSEAQESLKRAMTKFGPTEFKDIKGREMPDWYEFNRMYRNAATSCYNSARWESGQGSRVVIGYRWVAVMDDRTRPTHRALDGSVFSKSDPRTATYKPPVDQHCRCTLDYVYDWEKPKWSDYPTWEPAPGFGGVK